MLTSRSVQLEPASADTSILYPVTAEPLSSAGSSQDRLMRLVLTAVAVRFPGGSGGVAAVVVALAVSEAGPSPLALMADTR